MSTHDVYTQSLQCIEQIRDRIKDLSLNLKLPQLVVIGDQSSGKSSCLSEITGVPLPNKSGTCTKQPIVVYTKRSVEDMCDTIRFTINDEVIEATALEETILMLQAENLGDKKVDDTPITIHAEGADCWDLVLVDLPGIIANGDGKDEVIAMIRKYIADKQSLIIVVTEAQRDDENALALELAKEYDPEEERTLRVLTKFDTFDTEDNKVRAAELVQETGLLSAHAVVCRPGGEAYTEQKERDVLAMHSLPSDYAGIASLRARLPALLNERIRTNLPGLKKQIQEILDENCNKLKLLGESPPDSAMVLAGIQEVLSKQGGYDTVGVHLSPALTAFREALHCTKEYLTAELVETHYRHDLFKCPFFQGEQTFNQLLELTCDRWTELLNDLHKDIGTLLEELFTFDRASFPNVDPTLLTMLDAHWTTECRTMVHAFRDAANASLNKERQFKTMNHYLTSKYHEKLVLPDELLETIQERLTAEVLGVRWCDDSKKYQAGKKYEAYSIDSVREKIAEVITSAAEEHEEDFNRMPIDDQHKRRVLAAIEANWAVAHKSFGDNVLADLLNTVSAPTAAWVKRVTLSDGFRACAAEDQRTGKDRDECRARIEAMTDCLSKLDTVA